jgi:hypothetical protein
MLGIELPACKNTGNENYGKNLVGTKVRYSWQLHPHEETRSLPVLTNFGTLFDRPNFVNQLFSFLFDRFGGFVLRGVENCYFLYSIITAHNAVSCANALIHVTNGSSDLLLKFPLICGCNFFLLSKPDTLFCIVMNVLINFHYIISVTPVNVQTLYNCILLD